MAGMSSKASAAAAALQKNIPAEMLTVPDFVTLQHWYAMPWYNMVRFGKWNDILQIERPADSLKAVKAAWHYARGMALTRTNKLADAKKELEALKILVADPFMEMTISGFNSFRNVIGIGQRILEAEIEASEKNYDRAISLLTEALKIEDGLLYQEPPDWYHPTRQVLGGILLEAKKPVEAEQRFREDLKMYRNNGWSLYGLHQSLLAQKKEKEAQQVKKDFDKTFSKADITLTRSRF
jgi:tetratricopeptide (TPR) repeat protein